MNSSNVKGQISNVKVKQLKTHCYDNVLDIECCREFVVIEHLHCREVSRGLTYAFLLFKSRLKDAVLNWWKGLE